MNKAPGIDDARIKIEYILWYIKHYTISVPQQGMSSKQILGKTPTELRYIERSLIMKDITNQYLWTFELGSPQEMSVPKWIFVGFQRKYRQDSLNLNNDTFGRLRGVSAQCIIGIEKCPGARILLNCDDDKYSQGDA